MQAYTPSVPMATLQGLIDRGQRDAFWTQLEQEMANFDQFAAGHYNQIKSSVYAIIRYFSERAQNLRQIEAEANAVEKAILAFSDLIGHQYRGWFQLSTKLEKSNPGSIEEYERRALSKNFTKIGFGDFITMMSDVWFTWNQLKKAEEDAAKGKAGQTEAWVPPSAFIRSTRKYWVRLQDMTKLKLAIARNLPLLRFGKKQGCIIDTAPNVSTAGYRNLNNDYDGDGAGDESKLTSVYFDNDELRLYHDKITRKEGATLIRVRWYGKEGSTCFMERKTWHDAWVMNDSIKERFDLKYEEVMPFIKGELKAQKIVEDFQKSKPGKISEEGLREMLGLAQTVQKRILKLDLKPSVRTIYNRTAFQASDNNVIRISIDTSLHLSAEPEVMPPGRWCYDSRQKVPDHLQFMFPMAVLEIKLSGVEETPIWIQNIIDSDYVVDAYKFSKFMHSTASLKGYKCQVLPPWFNRPVSHLPGYPLIQWYRQPVDIHVNKLSFDEVLKWTESAPVLYPTPAKLGMSADRIGAAMITDPASVPSKPPPTAAEAPPQPMAKMLAAGTAPGQPKPPTMLDGGGGGGGGGGLSQPMISKAPQDNSFLGRVKRFFGGGKQRQAAGLGEVVPVMPMERVEPKTFFANERTFLNYLDALAFTALSGFTLYQFAQTAYVTNIIFYVGLAFLLISLIMVGYALAVFHWRRRKIAEGNPEVPLDDSVGPLIIGAFFLLYLIGVFAFMLAFPPFFEPIIYPVKLEREYRFVLDPFFFSADLSSSLDLLQLALQQGLRRTQLQLFDTRGQLSVLMDSKTISYYDTAGSCSLFRSGYRLIQITSPNGTSATQLDYFIPDPAAAYIFDQASPYASVERREIVTRRYVLRNARSVVRTPALAPASASDFAPFAPLPSPPSFSDPLVKVNNYDLTLETWGDFQCNFNGDNRLGYFNVEAYRVGGTLRYLELVIRYPYWSDQRLSQSELLLLKNMYDQLAPTLVVQGAIGADTLQADVFRQFVSRVPAFCN